MIVKAKKGLVKQSLAIKIAAFSIPLRIQIAALIGYGQQRLNLRRTTAALKHARRTRFRTPLQTDRLNKKRQNRHKVYSAFSGLSDKLTNLVLRR